MQILKAGVDHQGWRTNLTAVGTYGADYLARAGVAYAGLGANTIEDAVYPTAFADADGKPFTSEKSYVLHFGKDQIPQVRGFWSLTMYDQRQAFAANPIDRYAIGDRDKLTLNPDGSLDIYIQRDSPGKDKEFELAAGAGERSVHNEYAPLLAQVRDSRGKLAAAGGEARDIAGNIWRGA